MRKRSIGWLFARLGVVALLGASPAWAAPQFDGPSDDLLMDDLDQLLDELPGVDPPSAAPDAGEDLGQPSASPLAKVESAMSRAGALIQRRNATGETRVAQQQAVDVLDEMIKQAEKNCKPCQSSSSPSPSPQRQLSKRSESECEECKNPGQAGKPGSAQSRARQAATQSTNRLGAADAAAVERRPPAEVMKEVWGRLPQRLREQMLESSSDEFLPQYREDIERYFQRLAEEPK